MAFASWASDLVADDANDRQDVFVRDRTLGTTTRISLGPAGAEANDVSDYPTISGNGQIVAFSSWASNLVAADGNGAPDTFVHDRGTATTSRVSVSTAGAEANAGLWFLAPPALSFDGRYVAFASAATNLVASDGNNSSDVFLRDRVNGTTTMVSVDTAGSQGNQPSWMPAISDDGRWVAFETRSPLAPADWWGDNDVYLRDRLASTTTLVSVDALGNHRQWYRDAFNPAISANGACVAFGADSELVALDFNNLADAFLWCSAADLWLFADGFESGTRGQWSSSTPP